MESAGSESLQESFDFFAQSMYFLLFSLNWNNIFVFKEEPPTLIITIASLHVPFDL